VHLGDMAGGCSDLEMTWVLCCAGAATENKWWWWWWHWKLCIVLMSDIQTVLCDVNSPVCHGQNMAALSPGMHVLSWKNSFLRGLFQWFMAMG